MKKTEKQNELKNFIIRFSNNDFMFDMLWAGQIIANIPKDRIVLTTENIESVIKQTMFFVLQMKRGERAAYLLDHLSNRDEFLFLNEDADAYLVSGEFRNRGENLTVDFRLPKEQQVNVF